MSFAENGYVLLPGRFSAAECNSLRVEADAIVAHLSRQGNLDATWPGAWREREDGTRVLSVHGMHMLSAAFTRMMADPRILDPIEEIIGPDIQLHHMKMHHKPAGEGSPFPLHQDYPYFPHELETMLAAVVCLDAADAESGGFCVVPGSHRLGALESVTDGSYFLPPEEWPLTRGVAVNAAQGDLLLLHYKVVHGSYPNRSPRDRRIVLFQYRSPHDRPLEAVHLSAGQGTMVRGRAFREDVQP